jgi:hypothetical protein
VLTAEGTTFHQFQRNLDRIGVTEQVRAVRSAAVDAARGWR